MRLFGKSFYFFKNCSFKSDSKISVFNHHFFVLKYYLKPVACEDDFANLLNITVEELNIVSFNYHYCSFNILLNQTRYKHLLEELQNPLNADLPIRSILNSCGAANNISFLEFFKEKNKKAFYLF
jgi:hypothetical protein